MVRATKKKELSKQENDLQEHVIVQLPIPPNRVEEIINEENDVTPVTKETQEPTAYEPHSQYICEPANSMIAERKGHFDMFDDKKESCFWCCHSINHMKVSLPIRYDAINETFITTGNFCSYECASAYNFDIHQGTDKMWEINSWLQTFAEKIGIDGPIRPAPSRYCLQMFGGPMNIHEFRGVHKNSEKLVLCNIPPLITVMPQTESINTSYLTPQMDNDRIQQAHEKLLIKKKTGIVSESSKNTIDAKLKVTYSVGA